MVDNAISGPLSPRLLGSADSDGCDAPRAGLDMRRIAYGHVGVLRWALCYERLNLVNIVFA